jgi:hypothetical protein
MENSFTLKQMFLITTGFGYLVNHRSKEIHRLSEKHRNCHLDIISPKNSEHVTKRTAINLIKKKGYNGCRWCMQEIDLG